MSKGNFRKILYWFSMLLLMKIIYIQQNMRTKRDSITDNFECVTVVWEFATCIDSTPVNNNCLESNVNVW